MLLLLERPATPDIDRDPRIDRGALEALRRRGFSDADIEKALANVRSPVTNEVKRPR